MPRIFPAFAQSVRSAPISPKRRKSVGWSFEFKGRGSASASTLTAYRGGSAPGVTSDDRSGDGDEEKRMRTPAALAIAAAAGPARKSNTTTTTITSHRRNSSSSGSSSSGWGWGRSGGSTTNIGNTTAPEMRLPSRTNTGTTPAENERFAATKISATSRANAAASTGEGNGKDDAAVPAVTVDTDQKARDDNNNDDDDDEVIVITPARRSSAPSRLPSPPPTPPAPASTTATVVTPNTPAVSATEGVVKRAGKSIAASLAELHRAHIAALQLQEKTAIANEALRVEKLALEQENNARRRESESLRAEFAEALRDNRTWCRANQILDNEFNQAFLNKTAEMFDRSLELGKVNERLKAENEALKRAKEDATRRHAQVMREVKAWRHENTVLHEEYTEHLNTAAQVLAENARLKDQVAVSNQEYARMTMTSRGRGRVRGDNVDRPERYFSVDGRSTIARGRTRHGDSGRAGRCGSYDSSLRDSDVPSRCSKQQQQQEISRQDDVGGDVGVNWVAPEWSPVNTHVALERPRSKSSSVAAVGGLLMQGHQEMLHQQTLALQEQEREQVERCRRYQHQQQQEPPEQQQQQSQQGSVGGTNGEEEEQEGEGEYDDPLAATITEICKLTSSGSFGSGRGSFAGVPSSSCFTSASSNSSSSSSDSGFPSSGSTDSYVGGLGTGLGGGGGGGRRPRDDVAASTGSVDDPAVWKWNGPENGPDHVADNGAEVPSFEQERTRAFPASHGPSSRQQQQQQQQRSSDQQLQKPALQQIQPSPLQQLQQQVFPDKKQRKQQAPLQQQKRVSFDQQEQQQQQQQQKQQSPLQQQAKQRQKKQKQQPRVEHRKPQRRVIKLPAKLLVKLETRGRMGCIDEPPPSASAVAVKERAHFSDSEGSSEDL